MPYDLFISYSRQDNRNHRITELKDRIAADYLEFSGEELRCFFDLDDIHGMDDWRHRILEGLRESSLLLLVLSPGYLASEYCEWEIVEFLKYEHSRAAAGQGVAPVYFVEVPGLDTPGFEQEAAAWVARVRRRNHFDLRPWHDEGVEALKREDVRSRLKALEETLHASIAKMRRIANAPGNLASHNPHFVGRETEMLRLHEAAGLGRFGVLTALQGMGGLGKTALAIQYAYAYADFYPGGRWLVGCAGKTSLAAIIRELDADLGITFTDEEKGDDIRAARRVLAELETRARNGAAARAGEKDPPQPRVLLLLDNVDDPALLQTPQADLISGKRWLHVIATTRLANDELGHDPGHQTLLAVDELPLEDAVRLIESHQPGGSFPNDVERAAAHDLAALLGGFTLAVEVVAVHLGERLGQITCAAFRDRLQREGLGGLETAAKATRSAVSHRQKLIGATLGPTLYLLDPEESLVLAYAALLPPDTIPLPWLRALVAKDHPTIGQDAAPGYDDPWLSLVNHLLGLRCDKRFARQREADIKILTDIHPPMNLAFDIDDTITAMPGLFAALSTAVGVDRVIIVSSRMNRPEILHATRKELDGYGVRYDQIHLIDDAAVAQKRCPHPELDWYQQYLWQKVEICLRERVDVVFEDDVKVIALFRRYAPEILVLQAHQSESDP